MTAPATHVVTAGREGLPSRVAADASSAPDGPVLAVGQEVAVLDVDDAGVARVELADGRQVWVDAAALEPVAAPALATVPAAPPAVAQPTTFAVGTKHPPPPAPGTDAPVRIGKLRLTTQLIGGALLIVGCFLPWLSSFYGRESAFGVPLEMLISPDLTAPRTGFLKLGFLLFPLSVVVLVAGLRVLPSLVGQVAGGVAAFLTFAFLARLQLEMGNVLAATVFGVIGNGVYLALFGGVLAALSKGDRA